MSQFMGNWNLEFSRLCDYADIIKKTNPESSCWTETTSSQPAQPMAPPPNRAYQNMNPPSMCTDTSTFATNATGRGRGRDNAQPTNNGSTQPTTRTKKPKQSTGFGIYTDIQSGRTVLNVIRRTANIGVDDFDPRDDGVLRPVDQVSSS
ncbi:hypothetical protein R3W88_011619 [Solanum pinnatisectum]|uniref:Uncharacterized protein n=1 Tax=Solanum pinnatisectum TaxID=50273 RepID=A0AAV9L6Q5_9SOLN|nr:hypothetical protein R3W88_011619 [Solanum pinnatisectum]